MIKKILLIGLNFLVALGLTIISFGQEPDPQECQPTGLAFKIFLPLIVNSNTVTTSSPAPAPIPVNTPAPTELCTLPLTFPVQSSEIAAYFNQVARPEDIAAFPSLYVQLLPQVTAGQKMVVFRSWAEAEQELAGLIDQIELVGYNPEHWEYTPLDEQQNLPATVQQAAAFAHAHGLQFMLIPDRQFAEAYLDQFVPHVDIIILQGQRLQDDPQAFAAWMGEMISLARASNPAAQIYVQVGATQGSASEMLTAIQTVANDIDGIAVWSLPRSFDILQEFVSLIRPEQ